MQIDALYAGFVDSLPPALRPGAVDLPYLLKLAPAPGVSFAQVFNHPVTLGAPLLIAEAFPNAPSESVRFAALAHALAVIEAFGTDRIADEQVECTAELLELFEELRQARDRALDRVLPGAALDGMRADAITRAAIAEERALLKRRKAVDLAGYDRVSLGKQAVGFPASLALARALADQRRVRQVELILRGVWLGLQAEDDVIDWEDDWRSGGGAWAFCLARSEAGAGSMPADAAIGHEHVRDAVLNSGILRSMLDRARQRYRAARRHAQAIGARSLSSWAARRELRLSGLIPLEARFAGYSVRAHTLGAWAAEVLT